jgi:DNA mismatch repair ATPase MutS
MALIVPRGSLAWFVLQAVLHWDRIVEFKLIHTARAIGGRARIWIDAIGQVEAISAMASLADLNPDWVFPQIGEPGGTLRSNDLGHPLIPVERMVANDVEVGPAGRVLIVTGSNMAGKSTLLRTIGLNSVLALAGGPVCASQLSVPNQPIWSSVRITDSLEQGVSLYMAELLRLKDIVDAAETSPITYLLDEILHGTNTTERRIAARQVISRLLRTQSIGVVSTHDLELVDEHLSASATCVHLVDQVNDLGDGPAMTFDYKVRPGLAPTSNALRLLKLVGLAEEPTS